MPVGIARVGLDERLLEVNERLCEIAGRSADELTRMKVSDLVCPEDRARDGDLLGAFLGGRVEQYENEARYLGKDGEVRWVSAAARLVTDDEGRPLCAVQMIRDFTDGKAAEERLRDSETSYRRLFEAAQDGLLLIDPDTRKIADANPYMTELLVS